MKRRILGILVLLVLFLITGCARKANHIEDRNLKIGLMPDIGMYPLLVAETEGYFKAENLNVELTVFKSANDRNAALQGGQINGMMGDLLVNYFLNTGGVKVKATSLTESRFLLLAGKDAGITSVEDLQNVEVGLSVSTVIEYLVDSYLGEKNIAIRKVNIPQVPVRMELVRSGQLKAAAMPDPLATVLAKSGAIVIADSRDMQLDPAVLIFTEPTLTEQTKALKSFFTAYNKAVKTINADPEKYRYLLLEKGDFPESVISDIEIPVFREAEVPSEAEVNKLLNWVHVQGYSKGELTYTDLVATDIFK